jgi:UPF0176 protein
MILNIAAYQFVEIEAPESFVSRVREALDGLDLRGTILVAGEGINLFLAGAPTSVEAFLEWLRADPRFAHIVCKRSFSETQPFARLKVKLKSEIISFRQGKASPLAGRAPAVEPGELARWIAQGHDDEGKRLVLLDTRNRQEVAFGTFEGALHFPIDKFTDLPTAVAGVRHSLEDATVVSFLHRRHPLRKSRALDAGRGHAQRAATGRRHPRLLRAGRRLCLRRPLLRVR